ncbi:tetratricopeptide repeat protein [Ascidiimonas aurantiaca]|uniref:tetratricopeptide repeat protein n=1 Tax=Ascidiimonas aurantiaca TaxID=1685432 RepID=UPI0030EF71C9
MRKQFLIFSALICTTVTFAQKTELKAAEKALKTGDNAAAKTALQSAEPMIAGADIKYQVQYHMLKGQLYKDMAAKGLETDASYEKAVSAYKEVIALEENMGKKRSSDAAQEALNQIGVDLVNEAIEANKNESYEVAGKKLYMAYQLNKENTDYLYFAATTAVSSGDYDTALLRYQELKDIGYTGITTKYYVTEVATGKESEVSKTEYDLYKKSKEYSNFREEETASRLPEIVKNIALIYTQQGKTDEAIAAVKEARASNPDDVDLLLTEANLYIKNGQKDQYKIVMEEAARRNPDNPALFFNLGVIAADQGDTEGARKYYEKSLEVDPNYKDSYLNLAALTLEQEKSIVEEMNSLGTSRADNVRYEELKKKREELYLSAVPYLEKLLSIDPNHVDATKTLVNIYGTIGETEKYKELKAKLSALEQ